jgi:prefoldin alpha subunit
MEINQETLMKANFLQKESQEMEQRLEMVENQIIEFEQFHQSLKELEKSNEKEIFSSLGKGVHLPAEIKSKELLVEVGQGYLVKKKPEEVLETIEDQTKRLKEARMQMRTRIEIYNSALHEIVSQIEQMQKGKQR